MPPDFRKSIMLAEALGQVEQDLAKTLRAMAMLHEGPAAARQLKLADEAARGEQAAARASEHLQNVGRQWAEHADMTVLDQALERTATVLADLARAENKAVAILTHLAHGDDPDRAARLEYLAAEASNAGRHASDLAQALHQLVEADEVSAQPGEKSQADISNAEPTLKSDRGQRLAEIDQRLAGLRQARLKPPPASDRPRKEAQWLVSQAQRQCKESIAHLRQTRQLAIEALRRAASAHDRAADAHLRSAAAGNGDVAEHRRKAASHRAAAQADRQNAQQIHDKDEAVDPELHNDKRADDKRAEK